MIKINSKYVFLFLAFQLVGIQPTIGSRDLRGADKTSWTVQANCDNLRAAISYDTNYDRNLKNQTDRWSVELLNVTTLGEKIEPSSLAKLRQAFSRSAMIKKVTPLCLGDSTIWFEIEYISKIEYELFYSQSTNEIKSNKPKSRFMILYFNKDAAKKPTIRDIPRG